MEDLRSRQIEALSAHVAGLEAALDAATSEETLRSIRRLTRSLARTAIEVAWTDVAKLARVVHESPDSDLAVAARDLLSFVVASSQDARGGDPPPTHAEHRVLVVEDNRTVAAAVMAHLGEAGRTLHLAATAAEAERILAAHAIDLVILDLILPDRDGRDLLLVLREDPRTAAIPVIVVSAKGGSVARAECLAVGASEFIEKPADPRVLRAAVARHLGARRPDADARVDPATGLLSRAGLAEAYRALRSRTGRVEGPLAVAVLTLDPLARVVAEGRRGEADRLVRGVAERLARGLGERDRLGRWSDSELVALLPGTTPSEAKRLLEEGWRGFVTERVWEARPDGEPSFAVGVAVADAGADLREVVAAALLSLPRRGASAGAGDHTEQPDTPAPPRVLLVEDDRVTATLIHHRLVREGFDVMDFLNGEDAHRWASTGEFDVAILDVKVPGMDGFELLQRFRAMPHLASVPIVMLTSLGQEADVVRGLELGANDYMLKPFSPTELLARVRRLALEGSAGRQARAPRTAAQEAETR